MADKKQSSSTKDTINALLSGGAKPSAPAPAANSSQPSSSSLSAISNLLGTSSSQSQPSSSAISAVAQLAGGASKVPAAAAQRPAASKQPPASKPVSSAKPAQPSTTSLSAIANLAGKPTPTPSSVNAIASLAAINAAAKATPTTAKPKPNLNVNVPNSNKSAAPGRSAPPAGATTTALIAAMASKPAPSTASQLAISNLAARSSAAASAGANPGTPQTPGSVSSSGSSRPSTPKSSAPLSGQRTAWQAYYNEQYPLMRKKYPNDDSNFVRSVVAKNWKVAPENPKVKKRMQKMQQSSQPPPTKPAAAAITPSAQSVSTAQEIASLIAAKSASTTPKQPPKTPVTATPQQAAVPKTPIPAAAARSTPKSTGGKASEHKSAETLRYERACLELSRSQKEAEQLRSALIQYRQEIISLRAKEADVLTYINKKRKTSDDSADSTAPSVKRLHNLPILSLSDSAGDKEREREKERERLRTAMPLPAGNKFYTSEENMPKKPLDLNSAISKMMFAFGDVRNPRAETVNVLEGIVLDFVRDTTLRSAEYVGRSRRLRADDVADCLRFHKPLYRRVREMQRIDAMAKHVRSYSKGGEGADEGNEQHLTTRELEVQFKDLSRREAAKAHSVSSAPGSTVGDASEGGERERERDTEMEDAASNAGSSRMSSSMYGN